VEERVAYNCAWKYNDCTHDAANAPWLPHEAPGPLETEATREFRWLRNRTAEVIECASDASSDAHAPEPIEVLDQPQFLYRVAEVHDEADRLCIVHCSDQRSVYGLRGINGCDRTLKRRPPPLERSSE
jgi:hypothetical protein